jgi:uncharacterized protein YndB with AHSA1/START domain
VPATGDITIELDGPDWLVFTHDVPGIAPDELLRWFLAPDLLTRWWGQEATVEPILSGVWEIRWPAMGWTLCGRIADLSDTSLVVSWAWNHEPASRPAP